MSDEFGDDVGDENAEGAEAKTGDGKPGEKGEGKPNRANKPGARQGNHKPADKPAKNEAAESPTDNGDTPRARALQARARETAGAIRRRIGQTIKCPGCEVVAYAKEFVYDKPKDDPSRKPIARRIRCDNEECQYKKNTGRQWSRKVPLDKPVLNDDDDFGVMSARQIDHVLPKGD